MKIGIITFHWATNYGAILQSYALQTYLIKCGHEVVIIDYKPKKYDPSIYKIFTSRRLLNLRQSINNLEKEKMLAKFRSQYLRLTKRYYSIEELKTKPPQCDVYISGSDQVLNPSFTQYGERRKSPASSYYLDFGDSSIKRIGYAVSFGCAKYPEKAKQIAEPLLSNFDIIGVREKSGIDILKEMQYTNSCLVPDPTLLLEKNDFNQLLQNYPQEQIECFIYMLRNRRIAVKRLRQFFPDSIIADTDAEYSIESWISNIKNSEIVVTNSFHGVVFCLHYHVPFIVMLETKAMTGMNDRFYTLLNSMKLTNRIIEESKHNHIQNLKQLKIDWSIVDRELDIIKKRGVDFLNENLSV